jgi:hypothetical protein
VRKYTGMMSWLGRGIRAESREEAPTPSFDASLAASFVNGLTCTRNGAWGVACSL